MHNISFKGYTNIVSAQNIPWGNSKVSYIAAKLDDNGEKDLTQFREIRKLQGYPEGLQNDDIVTIIHVADPRSETFYYSSKPMCWGEQLKIVEKEYIPQLLSKIQFKHLEKAHLKAYTLLASLTKRMYDDKFENEDSDIKRVIQTLYNNFCSIRERATYPLFSDSEAFELTSVGCLKKTKFQPLARIFNKKIAQTMTEYFR